MKRLFNKWYGAGYSAAKKFVRITLITPEIRNNIPVFLEKVYTHAVSGLAVDMENSLSAGGKKISEFKDKIRKLEEQKKALKEEIINPDIEEFTDYSEERIRKLSEEVEQLNQKIASLNLQITETRREYIDESAKEKPNKATSKTSQFLSELRIKIKKLNEEFNPLLPWFLLVLVDYGIAVSFFSELAAGRGFIVEVMLGYAAPLAITLICMIFMQMAFDQIRKIRDNESSVTDVMLLLVPILALVALCSGILAMRILSSDSDAQDIIIQSVVWLLFVSLIISVGYGLYKAGKSATDLIKVPVVMLSKFFLFITTCILWPFENIYLIFVNKQDTNHGNGLQQNLLLLENRIKEHKIDKEQKERQIKELPKEIARLKIERIEAARKEAKIRVESEIKEIESMSRGIESQVSDYEKTEKILREKLLDLRNGAKIGAMNMLNKKLKVNSKRS